MLHEFNLLKPPPALANSKESCQNVASIQFKELASNLEHPKATIAGVHINRYTYIIHIYIYIDYSSSIPRGKKGEEKMQ